jgi:outer membrane protein OmpA-like peptidoglycan-associated protein
MKCWSIGAAAFLAACSASVPPPQPLELYDAPVAARAYAPPPDAARRTTADELAYTAGVLSRHDLGRAERKASAAEQAVAELHHMMSVRERADGGFLARMQVDGIFHGRSTRPDDAALPKLDAIARAIAASGDVTVRVECDVITSRAVAQQRADAVAAYLASQGMGGRHIDAVGVDRRVAPGSPNWDFRAFAHDLVVIVRRPVMLVPPTGASALTSPSRGTP